MVIMQFYFSITTGREARQSRKVSVNQLFSRIKPGVLQHAPRAIAMPRSQRRIGTLPAEGSIDVLTRLEMVSIKKQHVDRTRDSFGWRHGPADVVGRPHIIHARPEPVGRG